MSHGQEGHTRSDTGSELAVEIEIPDEDGRKAQPTRIVRKVRHPDAHRSSSRQAKLAASKKAEKRKRVLKDLADLLSALESARYQYRYR